MTGESSQYMGRAAYHREFSASQAACAESSYLKRAYTLPMRSSGQVRIDVVAIRETMLTVIVIVTYYNLLNLAVFAHLAPEILVEGVEVVLQLAWVHLVFRVVGGILVEIGQENSLAVGGFDMFP